MEPLSFLPPPLLSKPCQSPELWGGCDCQFTSSNWQDTIPATVRGNSEEMEQAVFLNTPPETVAVKQIIQLCRKLLTFLHYQNPTRKTRVLSTWTG